MQTMTIYKNYYTLGYRVKFAYEIDKLNAVTSEAVTIKLPEGAKIVELAVGGNVIKLESGEICDKIFTRQTPGPVPYIVDCSSGKPRNIFLKIQK